MMQVLADGVLSGAVLAVAALGLSLTYAVFRFPNFGHAEYLTAAAYGAVTGYALVAPGTGDALGIFAAGALAAVLAMLVVMAAARLVFARLIARGAAGALIIGSFAVGLFVRSLVALLFGVNERTPGRELEIAMPLGVGVRATSTEIAIVLLSGVLILLLHFVLSRTTLGKTLRAVAENPLLAGIAGISVAHVRRAAWALTALCCGAAGLALSLLAPVTPETGYEFLLPALAAVILGGIGSIYGTLVGALVIGLAESAAVHFGAAEWRQVVSFAVLILILLARPSGLFGRV